MVTAAPSASPGEPLVPAARAGNAGALGALYVQFGPALFRIAYHLTGTREDAEDVVHDVFVGLPEALARYDERGHLRNWLMRVTARVALMRIRATSRRRETGLGDTAAMPGAAPQPDEQLTLQAAVGALPDPLRVVLILHEIEGYSHAEIAATLGIRTVTSRVRLHRALRRLRRTLGGNP